MNKSTISAVVVALIVGLAFGAVVLPRNTTTTTTQKTTVTQQTTSTIFINNSAYPVVTATVITVLVIPKVATCTTISGVRSIIYTEPYMGESTTVTTVYPPNLPQQYYVTVVTASTGSASDRTIISQPDTC